VKRPAFIVAILCISSLLWAQEKGRVIEQIVARVNNEIITLSDFERSEASIQDEARQECTGCTVEKIQDLAKLHHSNLLRDLIDQKLLAQKGKDLGFNVEAEVVKKLDQIRQQYGWKDMDEMESQLRTQGVSMEDYKQTLRDNFLTQEVVQREVRSHVQISRDEVEQYYKEHQDEFNRPEYVVLSEFFLSTEKKPESDIPQIETKANAYLARIRRGESFEELAKRYSESSTAKEGGFLGSFQRGQLSKEIEDAVFGLKRNEVTDVIRTKTGFLILMLNQHYDAGIQPLDKVRGEIENRLAYERMQPEFRRYVAKLREESFIQVKPGYTDTAAVGGSPIVELDPAATPVKQDQGSKKSKKSQKPTPPPASAPAVKQGGGSPPQ